MISLKHSYILACIWVVANIYSSIGYSYSIKQSYHNSNRHHHINHYHHHILNSVANSKNSQQDSSVMTLTRFMIEATRSEPNHADLESLIQSIQIACKTISNTLSRNGVDNTINCDDATTDNTLYSTAVQVLKNSLRFTGKVGVLTSEDSDNTVVLEEAWNSKYVAIFDSLDGATNIDVGIVTGTIFSVYTEIEECLNDFGETISEQSKQCLLQNFKTTKKLVAAGYCMYSSATVMMLSLGEGVHGFTLDPYIGEFVLTHPNVKVPSRGRIYSINEANEFKWPSGLRQYISDIKSSQGETKLSYTSRYIGSLVGDVHRTLLKGGIFGYPLDSKRPQGRLRLLHEVRPISFLIDQAGGKSSTGYGLLKDVEAVTLHDHVSCFLGSYDDVTEVEKYLLKHKTN